MRARVATPQATRAARARVVARTLGGVLVAEGDSWFDYPFHDVLKKLEDVHDYEVESVAHMGDRVEDMAYAGGQLDELLRRIEKVVARNQTPRAILLSGGGNDVTGEALALLIDHAMATPNPINEDIVRGMIDVRLRGAYLTILSAVTAICRKSVGRVVPILIHGYDYPVPDGRGVLGGWGPLPGPWLEPPLRRKGYDDLARNVGILRILINRFNEMLATLPQVAGLGHVRHVDLRGTLSRQLANDKYKNDWGNELHPTSDGFARVAKKFALTIEGP